MSLQDSARNKGDENLIQLKSGKAAHSGAGPGTAPGAQGAGGFWEGGLAIPSHPKFLGKLGQAQLQPKFSLQVSLPTAASAKQVQSTPAKSQRFH